MKELNIAELNSLVKKSEAHARECPIEKGTVSMNFNKQIEQGYLTIVVSSRLAGKAANAFGAFVKYIHDKEGYGFTVDNKSFFHCPPSAVIIDEITIPVRIKEKQVVKINEKGTYPRRTLVSTGRLSLEMYARDSAACPPKVFVEPENGSLADVFEDITKYLKKAAVRLKAEYERARIWDEQQEAIRRAKKEHQQRIEERASVVHSIMRDVMLYERAELIRKYCDIAETRMSHEEYKESVAIARQIADWIDPTNEYVDELLSERYEADDFLEN